VHLQGDGSEFERVRRANPRAEAAEDARVPVDDDHGDLSKTVTELGTVTAAGS
jgi:hypothetical protein